MIEISKKEQDKVFFIWEIKEKIDEALAELEEGDYQDHIRKGVTDLLISKLEEGVVKPEPKEKEYVDPWNLD